MKYIAFIFFLLLPLLLHAQSAEDYYRTGKQAFDRNEFQASIDQFTKAINLSPSLYSYWYRASAHWQLFNYSKAADDYSRALLFAEAADDKSKLLVYRADCRFAMEDYNNAAGDYREYLRLMPAKSHAYNQLGRCYLALKQYSAAREAFGNAFLMADTEGDKAVYKYNTGVLEKTLLNYPVAEAAFTEALLHDTDYENAYDQRAQVFTVRKKFAAALADYRQALALRKTDAGKAAYYRSIAQVYAELKNQENAIEYFKKATEANPGDIDAWYDMGRFVKTTMKNAVLASSFLQKAVDLSAANDSGATYGYARIIAGQVSDALAFQGRRLNKFKSDPDRYKWELHNMACMLALSGNTSKANEYVNKSMAAGFDDYHHLVNDNDLKPLMTSPAWNAMLVKWKVPAAKR